MNINMKTLRQSALALTSATAIFFSPLAHSAGFEKSVLWSGKWAPLGGAAASSVSGAEALYFNPAGLAGGDNTIEGALNFSPIFGKFSGPIAGQTIDSNRSLSPSFGLFASMKPSEKLGIGLGVYAAGGSKAVYDGVDFQQAPVGYGLPANAAFQNAAATVKSDLSIIEASLGAGYEIIDGLRLGGAYRVSFVNAALSSYGYNPATQQLVTSSFSNMTATRWNGFRLGAQYYPKDSRWGLGAQWRTEVGFTAAGDLSGTATLGQAVGPVPAGTPITLTGSNATASDVFPQQIDIGGHYDILPNKLRAHLQYTFTEYSRDQSLALTGTLTSPTGTATNVGNIDQFWTNLHNIRVGLECFEIANWAFRAGYVFTSQVTPNERARSTFSSPGNGHTVSVGAGTNWMGNMLTTDLALEYSWASGTVQSGVAAPDQTSGMPGTYSSNDYAAHLGLTFHI